MVTTMFRAGALFLPPSVARLCLLPPAWRPRVQHPHTGVTLQPYTPAHPILGEEWWIYSKTQSSTDSAGVVIGSVIILDCPTHPSALGHAHVFRFFTLADLKVLWVPKNLDGEMWLSILNKVKL